MSPRRTVVVPWLLTLIAALAACGGSSLSTALIADGAWDGGPTDVPLTLEPLIVDQVAVGSRLTASFAIGDGGPLSAFVDTGSEGIQLLQSAVDPSVVAQLQLDSTPISETFSSGFVATGVLALGTLTLGDRTTDSPIPILLIQSFTCDADQACDEESLASAESDFFDGKQAILGIGLRNSITNPTVGNPIPQLPGHPGFIIEGLSFGGTTGTLHIGPTAEELSAFSTFQLPTTGATVGRALQDGTPAFDDSALPGCVTDTTATTSYCANALLDTGNPTTVITWTGYSGTGQLAAGDQVQMQVGPAATPIASFGFQVSTNPQAGQDLVVVEPSASGQTNAINFGLTVFFQDDVSFDPQNGVIGLRSH